QMRGDGVRVDVTREAAPTLFYLTYQGLNDRDVLRDYGELFEAPPDQGPKPRSGRAGVDRKIHVGFLSSHFRNHTVGELMRGLIAHLCRDRFVVHVLTVGHYDDEVARFLRQHADFSIEVTTNLPAARRTIAELGLDVLFYADIGMDPVTCTLALSRLAPVQCTTWGHPSTSGLPTIDYFLSSELFETENADGHYTEKLVRLRTIPAYCCRPEPVTLRAGPEDFGLPADCRLYACPQALFKIDPDFEDILGRLLRRDPRGIVTFHRSPGRNWHDLLGRRFAARIPDVADRIRFLPRLDHADYLRLNTAAAALLDPTAFNGGNTSYKGLALGTPIVTLPGELLRSRMTLAMYRKMGVMDCVAHSPEEYVEIAVHLAEDPAHRNAVRARILAANDVLYEDREAVSELDRFLQEAVAAPSSE
ncbi:MAG TPA: hypothetical protein VHR72_12045, partial [Gemmataceae bacterium]|nr:hypothetical protein [Gemmataceae bacterium]